MKKRRSTATALLASFTASRRIQPFTLACPWRPSPMAKRSPVRRPATSTVSCCCTRQTKRKTSSPQARGRAGGRGGGAGGGGRPPAGRGGERRGQRAPPGGVYGGGSRVRGCARPQQKLGNPPRKGAGRGRALR